LTGLSPVALCRNMNNPSISLLKNIRHYLKSKPKFEYSFWRNQNVAGGTVCTKPLRMCSFHQQRWFNSMNF
jgi:hypothetical protein